MQGRQASCLHMSQIRDTARKRGVLYLAGKAIEWFANIRMSACKSVRQREDTERFPLPYRIRVFSL